VVLSLFLTFGLTASLFAQGSATDLPGLSLVWSKNVGGLKSFALSPHARHLALLTSEGKLALWTAQDGNPVWATSHQTATNVLVSDGEGAVLTYNVRSPQQSTVVMRRTDTGAVIWSKNYYTSVWCAGFNLQGTNLAIGTGDNQLYLYDFTNGNAETKVPLSGTPVSTSFSFDSNSVLVGQWDHSGLSCYDLSGKALWLDDGADNRKYAISSVGTHYVTYIGSSNRHGRSPIAYVVRSSNGELLWAYDLQDNSYSAIAYTNDDASITGISYNKLNHSPVGWASEQKLAAIDRDGQKQWEKGGLFWSPTLICLTPDQSGLVVYDGKRKLYRLDGYGRTLSTAYLSDDLRQWSVSADNSSLVVYTHDGQLTLLHVQ